MKKLFIILLFALPFSNAKSQTINDLIGNDFFTIYRVNDGIREIISYDKKPPYWAFGFELYSQNKRFAFKSAINEGEKEEGSYDFKNNILTLSFDNGSIKKFTVTPLDKNLFKFIENKTVFYIIREPNKR